MLSVKSLRQLIKNNNTKLLLNTFCEVMPEHQNHEFLGGRDWIYSSALIACVSSIHILVL